MKGILINYEYCTGCHSCEVACRNERGLAAGEYGIKLTEVGPYEYTTPIDADTPYEWVYNPGQDALLRAGLPGVVHVLRRGGGPGQEDGRFFPLRPLHPLKHS